MKQFVAKCTYLPSSLPDFFFVTAENVQTLCGRVVMVGLL